MRGPTAPSRRSACRASGDRAASPFRTLRGRLVLLVCFAAVPAIVFIFYAAAEERKAALGRLEQEARQLAYFASREHAHQLHGARNLLLQLRQFISCGGDARPELRIPGFLPALLAGYPQYANIGVVGGDGKIRYAGVGGDSRADLADQPPFLRALSSKKVEVGTYTIGPIVRRPVLYLVDAVRNGAASRPCGTAFVAVDLRWLDGLVRQQSLPPDYALLIADRNGQVLAESRTLGTTAPGRHPSIPGLARLLGTETGLALAEEVVLRADFPPERRVFVASRMEGIDGVFAVASLPFGRVYRDANRAFLGTILGFGLLTTFTIAAGIVAADVSVLRVLRALGRTVRLLGAGDLSVRAAIPESHGELRDLSMAFNTLADTLAERNREAAAAHDQLRALSHRLQVAREEEASRIARELHDELGQVLTSVRIDLASLLRASGLPEREGAASQVLGEAIGRIDGTLEFVRQIASELRPAVLDRLGLAAALEWLARGFETRISGLAIHLDIQDVPELLPEPILTAVFRIAQEALTNAVRHAGATQVRIDLACADGNLELVVQDNGKGIDRIAAAGPQALGILGMRERARIAGGSCQIVGKAGVGTTVKATIPLALPGQDDEGTWS